jgi:hypothetical protein
MPTRPGATPGSASGQLIMGAAAALAANSVAIAAPSGWAAQRLAVIHQASGVCARCGAVGADTAFRSWDSDELLAGHTRCVVGLGPSITARGR